MGEEKIMAQVSPRVPRAMRGEYVVLFVAALFGVLFAFFTRWFPLNVADVHAGFGSVAIRVVWAAICVSFWINASGAIYWRAVNRSGSTTINIRSWPRRLASPMVWTWGRLRVSSPAFWARRIWLLSGILLGLYVGMTNRHWADEIGNGVFRFAAKLGLVLAGMLVGYLVFAWLAKKVIGVIQRVTPPTPAQPGPTP